MAKSAAERFCCRGCEFVAELIASNGLEQFYDLKQGMALAPVRSRPFEEHDFSWLGAKVAQAEASAKTHGGIASLDLALEGISCVGCVWLVERLFSQHDGAVRAVAQPASGKLHLEWLPAKCDLGAFLRELCQFGYVAAPPGSLADGRERRRLAARLGLCGAFAMNAMGFTLPVYLGMPADFEFAGLFNLIAFLSATLAMLVGGGYFIERAWQSLQAGSLHIDLPIALGLLAAYMGSIAGWALGHEQLMYFEFVATFVFLMLGGRYLQTAAVDRNRRRLVRQQPVPAVVPRTSGDRPPVPRDDIQPGLQFLLAPGQALPVSSVLIADHADFSLEWIHGEADPVKFSAGSRLPAGAVLLSRTPASVEASERWENSLLAKLTAAPTGERVAPGLDRVLRIYLIIVLILGLGALAFWGFRGNWLTGIQAIISVFVVSCPCALGVAIPLADDLAASAMERLGVFVRSGSIWARLRRVRRVIFDKTGTLTLERPVLINPQAIEALDNDAALALATMTRGSLHPISRSLLEALGTRGQQLLSQNFRDHTLRELPGLGMLLGLDDETWSLGKAGWSGNPAAAPDATWAGSELRRNGRRIAVFDFRESLRTNAAATLRDLERRNLSIHILSGDHPEKLATLAQSLEIEPRQALGGLSPEAKAREVRALGRHDALYLGDGANDSLAFDASLVTGTPVVDRSLLESKADFYTLGSGLEFLPRLLDVATARAHGVRTAFTFAACYNIVTVGFAMAGQMSPLLAAILMPASSIISIAIVAIAAARHGPSRASRNAARSSFGEAPTCGDRDWKTPGRQTAAG